MSNSRNPGRGRGQNRKYNGRSTGSVAPKQKGQTAALGDNMFTYGQKNSADKLRTSWDELTTHCGATLGTDIGTELSTKTKLTLPKPEYTQEQKDAHDAAVTKKKTQLERLKQAKEKKKVAKDAIVAKGAARNASADDKAAGIEAEIEVAELTNDIENLQDQIDNEHPLELSGKEKKEWDAKWKAYEDRVIKLEQGRGKAFAKAKGQCTQQLLEEMKSDPDHDTVMASNDPLQLYQLMERVIMGQSDDTYPFAVIYNQEQSLFGYQQNGMTNEQWYTSFNTRVDVAKAAGVVKLHPILLDYTAQDVHSKPYKDLTPEQKKTIEADTTERYYTYMFLRQSGAQHKGLKKDLLKDYMKAHVSDTGTATYPKTRTDGLKYLQTYSKTHSTVTEQPVSLGNSFAQRGSGGKHYDKAFWKDKTCHNCGKKGHPKYACTAPANNNANKDSNNSDEASTNSKSSKSSKSTKASKADALKHMEKQFKKVGKVYATMQNQLQEIKEADSDLSDSDSEDEGDEDARSFFTRHTFHANPTHGKHEMTATQIRAHQIHSNKGGKWNLNMKEVWLLDNQSTVDLFTNKTFLKNTRAADHNMVVASTGGSIKSKKIAEVPSFAEGYEAWYSPKGITNIIALANAIKYYRVTYDSSLDGDFIVHRQEFGLPDMRFIKHECGLHIYTPPKGLVFIQTVEGNMEGFTKKEIAQARKAADLYIKLIYPSGKDFDWVVLSNQIEDCPVTLHDVKVARKIWGKNIAALKGKTVRKSPTPVQGTTLKIPRDIFNLCKEVILYADLFFVNKIPFFITLSERLDFTAGYHLGNRTVAEIFKAFVAIYKFYLQRGLRIVTVHADGEFAPLQEKVHDMPNGPRFNLASRNEHVHKIERRIRVVKERSRSTRHGLPYPKLPKLVIIYMVLAVIRMLTYFPTKGGISEIWSPQMLLHGRRLNYKKDLALQFGSYCQVHEHETPRNSMKPRTQGAICLGPCGNEQGGYKFLTLKNNTVVTRYSWDAIPITQAVIDRVTLLAKDQPEDLTFTDRHGNPIGELELTGVGGLELDETEPTELNQEPNENQNIENQHELQALDQLQSTENRENLNPEGLILEDQPEDNEPPLITSDNNDEPSTGVQTTGVRRSTRTRFQAKPDYIPSWKGNKYEIAMAQFESDGVLHPDLHMSFFQDMAEEMPDVVALIMTQMSLKAGLKAWGKEAEEAAYSEMKQLHLRDTFRPVHYRDLTQDQRKRILRSHLFLKKKRSGLVKGRTVAGGNAQRNYISKEEASSPTVSTEAVLLTCIIEAKENRDVATIDIPNAFIQTRVEREQDRAIIRITGILVDMLQKIAPGVYDDYVTTNKNGDKELLSECLNAIYGTMIASLLYYLKFCKTLKREGFEHNPYDPCVWNKIVEGSQQTISFHVDDCKLSHLKAKVNDELIAILKREYESIFEDGSGKMKVTRGKIHEYLGMTLDYSENGVVKVSMLKYIAESLAEFEKIMPNEKGTKSSAAPTDLFVVDDKCAKLSKDKAEKFHSLVAKILFATKRARPDTGTAISFLMTRTAEPNKDDWNKLAHLMRYIRGTKDLPLVLSANGTGILKWWIDASYAVHWNMRGHTGGGLSMGRGFPITHSGKQKLNTRSSTECEVVGVDDLMPAILWTRMFLEAQGYGVKENIIYQDNQAAMLLEKNGKASSGKRTKHIAIRYFFVTDRVAKGDVSLEWCPTEDMTGDFWTKPLQGALFRRFRDLIMGVIPQPDPRKSKLQKKKKKTID